MIQKYVVGQRWISTREPELGLGVIQGATPATVRVRYPAGNEFREYGLASAPLRRVRFHAGDTVETKDGHRLKVKDIVEMEGLVIYQCGDLFLPEQELAGTLTFDKPNERLLAGQLDDPKAFDLRVEALKVQLKRERSPLRGFCGGRIDLLPHQLGIAAEVAGRLKPRVLLADEVGLGKTIEACLILHRLMATNRVRRALVLVPEPLVHQWFVELLRRFNLWAAIYDESRCRAQEETDPEANPFHGDQLILASVDFLAHSESRRPQALAAGWDLVIVDEAHHLAWSPEAPSPGYQLVEALAQGTEEKPNPGLLLLTATPEQLGRESHFARLRLLDPERFHDFEAFLKESGHYREVADLAARLLEGEALKPADRKALERLLGEDAAQVKERLAQLKAGDPQAILDPLLDQHGTGRALFRNTRHTVKGFPGRRAHLARLKGLVKVKKALQREFAADLDPTSPFRPDFSEDPRLDWLAELLEDVEGKVLLICRTRAKAEAVLEALKTRLKVDAVLFHEGLTLVQRDRGAAWFADPRGARLLVASEIGSEGRNFQMAHHLVLFDLPLDPSLLEQRLGRLDRIGQTEEIQVHVPFVPGTPQEVLVRWFHEGLNAFETSLGGGRELLELLRDEVLAVADDAKLTGLDALLARSREAATELTARLEAGRDRLLELSSARPGAAALADEIRTLDEDRSLELFLLSVLEHAFVPAEEIAHRTWQLGSADVLVDAFPGLPSEGLTFTWDRAKALGREDLQFMTQDHPLITGALDLVLGSEVGNCCFARWSDPTPGLFLEAIFVLEPTATRHLHASRFLPPTPLRVVVDAQGQDLSKLLPRTAYAKGLRAAEGTALLEQPEFRDRVLPKMLRVAHRVADKQALNPVAKARALMAARLDPEVARLKDLAKVNPAIRPEEIEALEAHRQALDEALSTTRIRLDSLRLIHRG